MLCRRRRRAMAGRGLGKDFGVRGAPALLAEPVGLVFAVARAAPDLDGFCELEILGLSDGDARALLGSAVPFRLDDRVRDRIVAETRGNPLALLELPRGLTVDATRGRIRSVGRSRQALASRLEESFQRRLETIPDRDRLLLLVAAAEPVGDPMLVRRAAERLGIEIAAADAQTDGLLAIGEPVTFRHPLVRSAVYRSATSSSAERCIWRWQRRPIERSTPTAAHGISQRQRPARTRRLRWSWSDPPAAPRRAAGWPPRRPSSACSRADRGSRATGRARAGRGAGEPAGRRVRRGSRALWPRRRPGRSTSSSAPRRDCSAAGSPSPRAAPAMLPRCCLKAARQLEAFDLELARETYLAAWGAAVTAGHLGGRDIFLEICRAAQALPASTRISASPGPSARRRSRW